MFWPMCTLWLLVLLPNPHSIRFGHERPIESAVPTAMSTAMSAAFCQRYNPQSNKIAAYKPKMKRRMSLFTHAIAIVLSKCHFFLTRKLLDWWSNWTNWSLPLPNWSKMVPHYISLFILSRYESFECGKLDMNNYWKSTDNLFSQTRIIKMLIQKCFYT